MYVRLQSKLLSGELHCQTSEIILRISEFMTGKRKTKYYFILYVYLIQKDVRTRGMVTWNIGEVMTPQ